MKKYIKSDYNSELNFYLTEYTKEFSATEEDLERLSDFRRKRITELRKENPTIDAQNDPELDALGMLYQDLAEQLYHEKKPAVWNSRKPIKSARYIVIDPESGEVLGSADTYEEAVNEWGEDVTITDSKIAGEVVSSRRIKSSNGSSYSPADTLNELKEKYPDADMTDHGAYVEFRIQDYLFDVDYRNNLVEMRDKNYKTIHSDKFDDVDDAAGSIIDLMDMFADETIQNSRQIKSANNKPRFAVEISDYTGSVFDNKSEAIEWANSENHHNGYAALYDNEDEKLIKEWEITSSRKITSAVDGGWRVDASDVPEALDLYVEYVGEENALESIARAMSSDTLKENIEWIAQHWGFGEDLEEYDDSWDMYEYAKEVMGESELFNNLTQAAGYDELAEDLAYIFRMEDFTEWDKYDESEEDDYSENIESSFESKHLMSRFAALSDEGQEYVLSQMNCDNEEELEDKIYSYADFYANRTAQRLINNAEREVYNNINSTPRSIVSSILNGTLTEEKAVQQIANKYDCNNGYARKLLNSWIDENKKDLIASGVIVNDYNKAFDRDGNLDSWYNDYVPEYGPANTVGGELVRAFQNMDIAYYNDGDMIGSGYGKQTVNPSARYILENARISSNRQINNWLTNRSKATPDKYLNFLESARTELEDFLRNNEELFHTPNNSFIGSAAEEDDMRIKECYLSDSEGNKYFLTKTGDNEWKCTDIEFSIDAQTWEEGDTFTDSDDSELDPTDEFGSFEKDGITYEWEAADDPDEDGNHHEWKITSVNVANQFCSKGDVFSDDDLDPDNLEYGFALYDIDGNEITEREFLANSLGRVYSAYVVGKGKVGIELNLNGWKTINIDGKPTGGTPAEFKNETEAMKSDIYTSLVDRYGEDKVRTFRQN